MKHTQSTRNSFTLRFTLRILAVMTGLLIPVVVAAQITNPRLDSHFSGESVTGQERGDGRRLPPRLRDAVHGTDRQQITFKNFHRTDSVVATWIRQYSSRLVPGDDVAYNIATDKDGNIYVNGYCQNAERGRDYITLKYDSSGTELWRALYNGTGNSEDRAYALAVDTLGNVYVTGASYGSSSLYDFATVKYNRFGVQQWEARYNGPGNSDDRANAIAVDTEGGVYVLGESRGSGTGLDITVVKYNSAGTEEWVTRYNGPGNMNDYGSAIAVDVYRNVYVTGTSTGDGTQFDYATIKYNSTGVEQWVSVYNGPGNEIDDALALYIAHGDVYVTGMSIGAGTYNDIATIKYNGAGVQQWVARYNREGYSDDKANAIAVDSNRNVYVTGSSRVSGSFNDYTTIKYDSVGIQQWVAFYDGPRGYYDEAYAIAVDAGGNVYVTGYSDGPDTSWDYATIKYNTAGNRQWVARYSGVSRSDQVANALTLSGSGSVCVTGWSRDDIVTVVYDHTSGAPKTVIQSDGPGNSVDRALAMAIDSSGNAYVAGSSAGPNGFSDYVTIKYRSDGTEDWVARYNGPSDSIDIANAIGVDRQGNVYVTGTSGGVGTATDIATVKYNSAGVQQWVARYNGPANLADVAFALAVGANGNVHVTGASNRTAAASDYCTLMYDSAGNQQWAARHTSTGIARDEAYAIALDSVGSVYITGKGDDSLFRSNYVTIKYNNAGVQQWVVRYNAGTREAASDIAVDARGNVYVTGYSSVPGTFLDYATVKYDNSGNEIWVARYNGPANSEDRASALAVDRDGNVYVTGESYGIQTQEDYATIKYDSSGSEQWIARYSGDANLLDRPDALALDAAGNVYVTGQSMSGPSPQCVTVKYSNTGEQRWVATYYSGPNSFSGGQAVAVDATGNIYVAGTHESNPLNNTWRIFVTLKYQQIPAGVDDHEGTLPVTASLEQNYPNPFNPATIIKFQIPSTNFVTLRVYDLLGREVSTLVHEEMEPGRYERTFSAGNLASGVYLYQLRTGRYVITKKLMLLK